MLIVVNSSLAYMIYTRINSPYFASLHWVPAEHAHKFEQTYVAGMTNAWGLL